MCKSVEQAMNSGRNQGMAYTLATILSVKLGKLSKNVDDK